MTKDRVNNPLGFSVIHEYEKDKKDNKKNENYISNMLKNKKGKTWTPDETVTHCPGCGNEFTFWLRKHHCRQCFSCFCDECTPFRKKIPQTWKDEEFDKHQDKKHRVCRECSKQIDVLTYLDDYIKIFSLIMPDIKTLSVMAQVSHLWNNISYFFLGKLRNIQYKQLNKKFSDLEKKILWTNRNYFIGHSHYTILFLKSLDYQSYEYQINQHHHLLNFIKEIKSVKKPKFSCMNLMCTKNCCATILPHHAIVLMEFSCRAGVCQALNHYMLSILETSNDIELQFYLPYVVDKLTFQNIETSHSWGDFLIRRCSKNSELIMELYWNLVYKKKETRHAIYTYHLNKLLDGLSPSTVRMINSSYQFVRKLEGIPLENYNLFVIKDYFRKQIFKDDVLPFDSRLRVISPYIPQIAIKKSATNPLMVPFLCSRNSGKERVNYTILYKFENVRQDYLILKTIRLMKYFLKRFENLDIEIVDYSVCPLDTKTGLIQIVPDCLSAYEIKEKRKFSIWNYIVEKNPHETVENLRKKFVKSCATYCVITYLLGVGDRHLDNIMITSDGKLFHIDYSYILGTDPKPISQPKIRITHDMIDALGGFESIYYREFLELSNRIFQGLRSHLNLFICLLSMVSNDDKEYQQIVNLLTSRFMPGETHKTAVVQLEKEIFRSTQQNMGEQMIDFFHYHNKEHTAQSVLNTTQQATKTVIDATNQISKKVGGMINQYWWGK